MKKIFTLVAMAAMAIGVNAQETKEELIAKGALFEASQITMGDIHWKPGTSNNHTLCKDKTGTPMYYIMGDGNAIEEIYAEEVWTDGQPTGVYRPFYTYIDYDKGVTGLPKYGLYFAFTSKVDGFLKVAVWVNKGNRKTCIVPASTGVPLTYGKDYQFEGYMNGQTYTEGDNTYPRFCPADEMLTLHTHSNKYVLGGGNQVMWGWLTLNIKANESYYVFQLSSQLGFGGFEFTPNGGAKEEYVALSGNTISTMDNAFLNIVDSETGIANNVGTTGRSVAAFSTANVTAEAVGSATPTDVVPGQIITGIANIKAAAASNANVPIYNLAGQKVDAAFKGMVIMNGKKFINK